MVSLQIDDVLTRYNSGVGLKENANATHDTLTKRDTYIVNEFHKAHGLSIAVGAIEHINGSIQIHDLGNGIDRPYCCGHDLGTLLRKGLGIPGNVQSGAARHLDTAVSQMIELLQICSNEFAGAQAFSQVNTLLAPFVYRDDLKYGQVRQQMQQLVYHLNYPSRQALQTPFSNLSFDWKCPDDMKDVEIPFSQEDNTYIDTVCYGDLQDEMDMIVTAFNSVLQEGDIKGRVFTFPIPTYSVEDEDMFSYDASEKHKSLWDLTAKFGSPYFMSYLGSGISPSSRRAMCCRLNLDYDEIADATGGVWNIGSGTGSIAITSINLNRSGLLAKGDEDVYFEHMSDMFWLCVDQCLQRKHHVFDAYSKGRLPYAQEYLGDGSNDPIDAFSSFFLTVGVVGAYEAWVNLGFTDETYPFTDFAVDTLQMLKSYTRMAREYEHEDFGSWKLWNLEQTPAEGCAPRFAALDRQQFPTAFVQCRDEKDVYLTNSTHLPVNTPLSPMAQVDHRAKTDRMYSGGTLLNWYTDEAATPESVCALIKNLCVNTELPYIAYSPTVGVCEKDGTTVYGTEGVCPDCEGEVEMQSRVVGYIRPVSQFNGGQFKQYENRSYMVGEGDE